MPDLVLELFSEEIPARMQARAADDLKRLVTDGLVEAGLTYASAGSFATPRRLVLTLEGLSAHSPTTREERRGPRTDAPEAAIEGFLRGAGVSRDQLEVRAEKKGEVFFAVIERAGRPAAEIIADIVPAVIRDFPWPKSMRWGAGSLRSLRPLQSILCILSDEAGTDVVPFDVDGIVASNTTEGHRFMAPARFSVAHFADYAAKLKRAHVVLSASDRAAFELQRDQFERERSLLDNSGAFKLDYNLNASVSYLWPMRNSEELQLKVFAENILSSKRRYNVSTGSRFYYPERLSFMPEPSVYGVSLTFNY